MQRAFCVSFAICLSFAYSAGVAAENWPQWRGPGGQGISSEKQLPTEWTPEKNVAWKVELPHGYSSPIVWGDRIFLTSALEGEVVPGHIPESVRIKQPHPQSVAGDKKHVLKVLALDTKTGKTVWEQTAYEGTVFDARHQRSTFAGPTAITDGKMVFAYFGPEGLYAYDIDGKPAWKVAEKFHTLGLGTGTSPILHENLVIIQRDEGRRQADVRRRRLRQDDRQGSVEDASARCRSAGQHPSSSIPDHAPSSSRMARST